LADDAGGGFRVADGPILNRPGRDVRHAEALEFEAVLGLGDLGQLDRARSDVQADESVFLSE